MKNIKSKVTTIANALVKQGVSRRVLRKLQHNLQNIVRQIAQNLAAMVRARITVKLRRMEVKAVGATYCT